MRIIIPGNAIAKKNSKRIVKAGKFTKILPSKAYVKWEKSAMEHLKYIEKVEPWIEKYPIELKVFFYRRTIAKFDFSNMLEGVQDVLQKAGVLIDDSMKYVIPVIDKRGDFYGWDVDRENPRVEIKITAI